MKPVVIKFRFTSLVMLGLILFLYSCSNDDSDPVFTVSGKVINEDGYGISDTKVFITGTNEPKTTGADGTFAVNGVTAPYELSMASGNFGYLYKGLTTFTPQLLAIGSDATTNSASLTVVIPSMTAGQQCRILFTDDANVQSDGGIIRFPKDSTTLQVYWSGAASITGKIIVLIYTVAGDAIIHYDKYGELDNYTINNAGVQRQIFTASDISVVPGNATVTGSIVPPADYNYLKSNLIINFGNRGSSFSGEVLYQITGNTFSYLVPTGLTTTPVISIMGMGSGSDHRQTYKTRVVNIPSSENVVSLETATELISPPDNESNINFNTNFTFTPGTGTGVNVVLFKGHGNIFHVFTTASTVNLPDFSNLGLEFSTSSFYNWEIYKFNTFTGIDQFVSSGIHFDPDYVSFTLSELRSFTTAP